MVSALEQVAGDVSGRRPLLRRAVSVPEHVDVQAIRAKLGLSQTELARTYGFSLATLRNWEQGRREPENAAKVLLAVIARAPDAVREALTGHGRAPAPGAPVAGRAYPRQRKRTRE